MTQLLVSDALDLLRKAISDGRISRQDTFDLGNELITFALNQKSWPVQECDPAEEVE